MKRLLMVFLTGFMVFKALGQPSVDVGIYAGAGTYFGDMTKVDLQKSLNLAYGGFVRYNFNPRYALRFNVINGTIGAQGEFGTPLKIVEPLDYTYAWDFEKNVLDLSLQFEFNYFKYIVGDKTTPYSSYLFGGIGMQTYNYNNPMESGSVTNISPTIPFGMGFKVNLSKRIGVGLEIGLRKTFSDKLDNLDDPLSYVDITVVPPVQVTYTDQYHNNDWTAYGGIHLVYKLIYGNRDWEVKTPKKKILDWGLENVIKKR